MHHLMAMACYQWLHVELVIQYGPNPDRTSSNSSGYRGSKCLPRSDSLPSNFDYIQRLNSTWIPLNHQKQRWWHRTLCWWSCYSSRLRRSASMLCPYQSTSWLHFSYTDLDSDLTISACCLAIVLHLLPMIVLQMWRGSKWRSTNS